MPVVSVVSKDKLDGPAGFASATTHLIASGLVDLTSHCLRDSTFVPCSEWPN